ncbi:MAG: hypothetical protein EOS30_27240 [Mesorhizobium sp.]|nr:hypothetical protein EN746_35825 [Mesorhizobium sp. M8A.F.Ca.ET.023.02.2.1]RWC67842.1 MAG: hypothetical protein EOS30_27240 [Mesorhizobium sp.]
MGVGAAPHLPAGILSPLTGRGRLSSPVSPIAGGSGWPLSPRLRGEMPGRAMRGGADVSR